MVPTAIRVIDSIPEDLDALQQLLSDIGCADVINQDISQNLPEIVFGSGALISRLRLQQHAFVGIECALPVSGYQHVIPKSLFGPDGTLYLIERIINGLAGYSSW